MRKNDHEPAVDQAIKEHADKGFKRPRYEIPDPTPMAPPIGYKKQPSMMENLRAMVRSEALRLAAEQAGAETFEESEDFDVEEFDPSSPWEDTFDPVEDLREARLAEAAIRAEADRRDQDALNRFGPPPPPAPPPARSQAPNRKREPVPGDQADD